MFSRMKTTPSIERYSVEIQKLRQALTDADAVLIGAGAGLSTSAGFVYSGERFAQYFSDFGKKYGFSDMYSGGFYPYETQEEFWAYWSRYIWVNRYMDAPKPVYRRLLELVQDKAYFVLTTNVDHCFQKAGFDKDRLFYTQGDYGLFQCSEPCHDKTYDNSKTVRAMVLAQGWEIGQDNALIRPEGVTLRMAVPTELLPVCPVCGRPLTMNLRSDDRFVEDEGWMLASGRYSDFLQRWQSGRVLYLELGVGYNTPVIIKYPFWRLTARNPAATYACINYGEASCPREIEKQSVCIDGDVGELLQALSYKSDLHTSGVEKD
ncbi:MAG: Sir2 silent information regulator family NAD-dependent deacetylase [Oscillospiraceae bacterium]|nr:Sir2 silent information regulator family NAD-dependent deacetylase [Oscillospiraceae bacterium]